MLLRSPTCLQSCRNCTNTPPPVDTYATSSRAEGTHARINGLLAYDLAIEQAECNHVIDGTSYLMRVGLSESAEHGCFLLEQGWEGDVFAALKACRELGGRVHAQTEPMPARPRLLDSRRKKKAAPETALEKGTGGRGISKGRARGRATSGRGRGRATRGRVKGKSSGRGKGRGGR